MQMRQQEIEPAGLQCVWSGASIFVFDYLCFFFVYFDIAECIHHVHDYRGKHSSKIASFKNKNEQNPNQGVRSRSIDRF